MQLSERESTICETLTSTGAIPAAQALSIQTNDRSEHSLALSSKIWTVLSDTQIQQMDATRRKLGLDPLPLDLIAFTRAATMRLISPEYGEIIPTSNFKARFYNWDDGTKRPQFLRSNNQVQAFYKITPRLTFIEPSAHQLLQATA